MATIVVPFRGPGGKQRLAAVSEEARAAIALAMLGDVLEACVASAPTVGKKPSTSSACAASRWRSSAVSTMKMRRGAILLALIAWVAGASEPGDAGIDLLDQQSAQLHLGFGVLLSIGTALGRLP